MLNYDHRIALLQMAMEIADAASGEKVTDEARKLEEFVLGSPPPTAVSHERKQPH